MIRLFFVLSQLEIFIVDSAKRRERISSVKTQEEEKSRSLLLFHADYTIYRFQWAVNFPRRSWSLQLDFQCTRTRCTFFSLFPAFARKRFLSLRLVKKRRAVTEHELTKKETSEKIRKKAEPFTTTERSRLTMWLACAGSLGEPRMRERARAKRSERGAAVINKFPLIGSIVRYSQGRACCQNRREMFCLPSSSCTKRRIAGSRDFR
jgi:hypothetical protein